jgi:hypothetical protein
MKKSVLIVAFLFLVFKIMALHSDTIDVINYAIHLKIDNTSPYNITGHTELKIVPKINNLSVVSLELLKLTVDSVLVSNMIANYSYNDTLLNINVSSNYSTSDTIFVKVYYHGIPVKDPSGWGGFYFTSGYAFNLGVGFQDNPHNYGRVWYPCVDDFIDRATYDFYITVNNPYKAICGGLLESVIDNGNGTSTYFWRLNSNIPTYLSSVAVGSYHLISDNFESVVGDIPILLYVRPADSTKAINSFKNLKKMLEAYENCFGPYRWDRVGYVSVPFNSGAMEHATNIAYPQSAIDGGLSNESLIAHELSHHWFGNLITCSTPEDMWINEGWASYCEPLFFEKVYNKNQAKSYIRAKHEYNLRYLHHEDNGFMPLFGIPHDYTYSTTVYDKGAVVVHSLRGQMGDSLFFNTVKAFLDTYQFMPVSSFQMKDFFTTYTGIDLSGFFNAWVFEPGWVHFSVDSFRVEPYMDKYRIIVQTKQKLRGRNTFAIDNKVPVCFMKNNLESVTALMKFSGETSIDTIVLDFVPDFVITDPEETQCDATTDCYKWLKATGTNAFDKTNFIADVKTIDDSVWMRVVHNWVAPDPFKTNHAGIILSEARYWDIEGVFNGNFSAKGKFYYNKLTTASTGYLDNELMTNTADSLLLFYRKSTSEDWTITPFSKSGNAYYGYLICDSLMAGQYAFGIYDYSRLKASIINQSCNESNLAKAFAEGGIPPYTYSWSTGSSAGEIIPSDEGKYTVTITDASGVSVEAYQWISFPKPLTCSIVADNMNLFASVEGGVSPYNYEWSGPNNYSAETQSVTVPVSGNYTVTITDRNNCMTSMSFSSSIQAANLQTINIYPNPAHEFIHIELPDYISEYNIHICDMQMKKIGSYHNSKSINIKHLQPASYYLIIENNEMKKQFLFQKM